MRVLLLTYLTLQSVLLLAQQVPNVKEFIPQVFTKSDTVYYDSNNVQEIIFYMEDDIVKTKLTFYENGVLKSCLNYNKFKAFDGEVIYWYENGQKRLESVYQGGAQVGDDNYGWKKDGSIEYRTICSSDTCTSTYYSSSGNILGIIKSKGMKLFYEEKRCDNGEVISIDSVGSYQINYREYQCNGSLKLEAGKNKKGAFVGVCKLYFENGQLRSEGSYYDYNGRVSLKNGEWKYYNKQGKVILIETYDKGELISQAAF